MKKAIKSKALRLPFKPNKFQPLQHCDNIANYYADVLFALYTDVRKEWSQNPNYHCVVKSGKSTKYILFTNTLKIKKNYLDENIKEYSAALQNIYGTVQDDQTIKKDTIIFAGKSINKDTVENIAITFVYGDEFYRKQIIIRYDNYFTIVNSLGDKIKKKYSDGGKNKTGMTKMENFRKISLTALMENISFDEGRKLGQRSKSPKKQAAARANGSKNAIRYKTEITDNKLITEYEFKSGSDCFEYFSRDNGEHKIFNNDMAFRRAMKNNNGKYEYTINGIKIVITQI